VLRQAKARGVRVTAEVTPHHLLLTDELAASYDPVFKVNPPLRTRGRRRLREALIEGVIDVVATDHAPHAVEDKECEWAYARPGMVGLETALPIVLSVLGEQWDLIAERMSRTPARIAGLAGHGTDLPPARRPTSRWWTRPPGGSSTRPSWRAAAATHRTRAPPCRVASSRPFLRGEPTVLDGKAVK
jgi:dihydroorotase